MGRVETRMYKRKRQRKKTLMRLTVVILLAAAALIIWKRTPATFVTEWVGTSPTPVASAFDRTVETREVTLTEDTWYAIQTGVFSTQDAAILKADAYTERGAPGTVVQEGEKWRVFIACYGTEADANAVRTRLEQNQRVDTYLYAWRCPELRLRLTGMAGQVDAVEAGFTLLSSTAAALRDTATELDAAQLTTQEVHAALNELNRQIALWEDTIHSRFGKSVPELVQSMLAVTENWDGRYGVLQASESATSLSASLKTEAMGMYHDIVLWRKAAAAQ